MAEYALGDPRVSLADYWIGRDATHAAELPGAIRRNAAVTGSPGDP